MTSTPIALGKLLDSWVEEGRVSVVEGRGAITLSALDEQDANSVRGVLREVSWAFEIADEAGEDVSGSSLDQGLGPYILTAQKPVEGADQRFLTKEGLSAALSNGTEGICQVACLRIPFSTGMASFVAWGHGDLFAPAAPTKRPVDIVRESSDRRMVPSDIRVWIPRAQVTEEIWNDPAFQVFVGVSAPKLVRSVCSEVVGSDLLVFGGPPRAKFSISDETFASDLGLAGYQNLRAMVEWVYELAEAAEQRHALLTVEIARSVGRNETIGWLLKHVGREIYEGARLAFQLSLSDLSREAIKAQGDLRKAIAEDTAKATESARSLSGAIAVAIATSIGLVAARATGTSEPWVLSAVGIVVAGYLVAVAATGWSFLRLQDRLRQQWRTRFYRFVPEDDYVAMVVNPARSAARAYNLVGMIAILVALVVTAAAVLNWFSSDENTNLLTGAIEGVDVVPPMLLDSGAQTDFPVEDSGAAAKENEHGADQSKVNAP